ncbi:hypothetical protein MRB53_030510 [Persea americana]|uniref:Uncharacterized protein n=1 Tax=Persea americana TaxID=3435 RepID=A0ACC2KLS1_PERAE|nr:hypothetical protein MRB53_030510 [Persea americana]
MVSLESGEGDEDDDKDHFPGSTKLEWIWEERVERGRRSLLPGFALGFDAYLFTTSECEHQNLFSNGRTQLPVILNLDHSFVKQCL